MVESRWLRWIGPGLVALGAVGFIASTTLGAGVRPWAPATCAGPPAARILAAAGGPPPDLAGLRRTPWFRLDPILGDDGALRGQRLTVGLDGERTARSLDLPSESFAAGPFGRIVLAGSDDGARSRLQAIDVGSGCAWSVANDSAVIRRATVDRAGATIFEMRVDRATRADLGIWRRPMDGGSPTRVMDPIGPDERFGRTFSTDFTWDLAGDRLAVQSCGELACRVRLHAPGGGPAITLDAPDLGPVIGLDGDRVVTYESCRGLPCPIVATDLRTGERQVLASAAGLAIVAGEPGRGRLVHELGAETGRTLRAIALDGGSASDLGALPAGLRLHPGPVRAEAGTRLPPDWILLAPDGRLTADANALRPQLRHLPDGWTVAFDEALR